MKTALEKTFEAVAGTINPQLRGVLFQDFLRNLLIESRFEVHQNARAAKPRQSDLLASRDDLDFLIEAKWLKKKIDVSDIDDLRARLRRIPGNFIGCLFSMSEFAPTAVQAVEVDRQNEILLFRPAEIENLVRCGSVDDLIKRKRKSFRIDGKVWFSGEKSRRESLKKFPFPEVTRSLRFQNTGTDFFENRSGFNPVVFTSHVPDFCGCEKGVRIDVTPQLDSISDLRGFLALVHNQLGLSSEGSFTISQIGYDWHGFGIENLLKEAERWKERYERARLEHIHHSEDLHYFDECHSGFILLTVRQQVKYTKAHLHGCRLQIQLPGIPIDTRPFVKICEGVRESLPYFAALATRESDSAQFRDGICLESVGQIISTRHGNEPLVCGLVVKNPFFEKKIPLPEGRLKYSPFTLLDSLEHLICDMSDWHNLNDIADQYRLTRLEGIQIADATIFRPVCTWDNIINRKFSNGQENQPLPSALDLLEREK